MARHAAVRSVAFALAVGACSASAQAQVPRHAAHPWCAVIRQFESTQQVCTFDSFEQCRIEAIGFGWCNLNPYYQAPPPRPPRRTRRH